MTQKTCGNLLNEYYIREFRKISDERSRRIAALKTKEDAERYVAEVRSKVRAAFPFSDLERTPLSPQVTSDFTVNGIVVENLMFDSVPDFPVTANFYRPANFSGKLPAVLHLCGHNLEGKTAPSYKTINQTLAACGIAVLTIDPLDQGERQRNPAKPLSQNFFGHNLIGKRLWAAGSWFGVWHAWDAVRGLDYLLSRPEVDAEKIYIIGCSGGGTMTTLVNALEDRFAGALPSCYITSWRHNIENEQPVDAEQVIPGISAAGLEMCDLLIAAAPRPVRISGEANDFFDVRGTREAFEEVKKIYTLLGYGDRVTLFIGPGTHGFNPEQQKSAVEFLCNLAGITPPAITPAATEIPDEKLRVLKEKSVFELPGVKSCEKRLQEEFALCKMNRQSLTPAELRKQTSKILNISPNAPSPYFRILRPDHRQQPYFSRYLLEDGELPLGILRQTPEMGQPTFPEECFLYVASGDYRTEVPQWIEEFPQLGCAVFDTMVTGEMESSGIDFYETPIQDTFRSVYRMDHHFCNCSLMLGRPLSGLIVSGILGALKLMRQGGANKITLIGGGLSAVPTLFAAYLGSEYVERTILVNLLPSYEKLAKIADPVCAESSIVPGFLKLADLPDIIRAADPELREDTALPDMAAEY